MAKEKATSNPTSTAGDNTPEVQATAETRPPSPQQSQPMPTPQIPEMVPLDALAVYLMLHDPNKDWTATLAGFSLTGGMPAIPNPTPTKKPLQWQLHRRNPLTLFPYTNKQAEPLDVSPFSAYQDPNWGETEEKDSEGKASEGGEDKSEETPIAEAATQEAEREEIDLNEMARKQGLMTDNEFQSILGGGDRIVVNSEGVAEVLDLASQAVGGGETAMVADESEGVVHQPVEEVRKEQPEENDSKAERQKPKRVSQRCFGKWTSNKAGANTAADAVEISSEDERTTPTKPGEKPSTTSQKDAPMATRTSSSTQIDQKEEANKVAEGLDLTSKSVGQEEETNDDTSDCLVTEPTAQVEHSTLAGEENKEDESEDKYLQERKRKGKAPAKKKQVVKKQRTANTTIVI
ncbi:uncharacterized protein LOC125195748 [Salvia hispanica]|uniref:uncharacterized protein LOC125195748 n=1 Tax=Salvia hispanica TaxID=49212 RepID=UPI0020091253|nr:uncharacterized protein LOC125195748 [Salvia hispanica]